MKKFDELRSDIWQDIFEFASYPGSPIESTNVKGARLLEKVMKHIKYHLAGKIKRVETNTPVSIQVPAECKQTATILSVGEIHEIICGEVYMENGWIMGQAQAAKTIYDRMRGGSK